MDTHVSFWPGARFLHSICAMRWSVTHHAAGLPASVAVFGLIGLLAAATAYETADALRIIKVSEVPGRGPAYEGPLIAVTVLALLAAAPVLLVAAAWPRLGVRIAAVPGLWLVPSLCAALVLARFYAFDPYYAPTLRRASDGGILSWAWIGLGLGVSAVVAAFAARVPRAATVFIAGVLLYTALTVLLARAGH